MNSDIIALVVGAHAEGHAEADPRQAGDRVQQDRGGRRDHEIPGNLGSDPFPGNSTMLKELLIKDIKAWAEYVKIAKIEPLS